MITWTKNNIGTHYTATIGGVEYGSVYHVHGEGWHYGVKHPDPKVALDMARNETVDSGPFIGVSYTKNAFQNALVAAHGQTGGPAPEPPGEGAATDLVSQRAQLVKSLAADLDEAYLDREESRDAAEAYVSAAMRLGAEQRGTGQ